MKYENFLKEIAPKIFLTDSPTGYSNNIDNVITEILNNLSKLNYLVPVSDVVYEFNSVHLWEIIYDE